MQDFLEDDYTPLFLERTTKGKTFTIVDEWCEGFLRSLQLWGPLQANDMSALENCLPPIRLFATDEGFAVLKKMETTEIESEQKHIAPLVRKLYRRFQKQRQRPDTRPCVCETARVGRNNDPLPAAAAKSSSDAVCIDCKSYGMPPDDPEWTDEHVKTGHYSNASGYVHGPVRRDQEYQDRQEILVKILIVRKKSGISKRSFDEQSIRDSDQDHLIAPLLQVFYSHRPPCSLSVVNMSRIPITTQSLKQNRTNWFAVAASFSVAG